MIERMVHTAGASDDDLAREASEFLTSSPPSRFLAELWRALGAARLKWWTPKVALEHWPVGDRMSWLRERPDIRQRIATDLTGLPPNTARKKLPEFQAALIEEALEGDDLTPERVDGAFGPDELAIYAPPGALWEPVVEMLRKQVDADRGLTAEVIGLAVSSSILRAVDLRRAIDPGTWQARIPLGVRAAVDKERIARELSGQPFTSADELMIVGMKALVENLSARELAPVLGAIDAALRPPQSSPRAERPARNVDISDVALTVRRAPKQRAPLPPVRPPPGRPQPAGEEDFEDGAELLSVPPPPPGPPGKPKRG